MVVLLLVIWWVFFSRLRWKVRLIGLGAFLVVALLLVGSLRVQDLSGDLMPILGFRWTAQERPTPPEGTRVTGRETDHREVPASASQRGFPQYLGPDRNGEVRGVELSRDWQATPPEEVWRRDVGEGWSGFAVASGLAVTQEQYGPEETVRCYDAATGALRWSHADTARQETPMGGVGPRATPTISDGRVFAQGATGILNVLDLDTGERLWSVDVLADNDAPKPSHGGIGGKLFHIERAADGTFSSRLIWETPRLKAKFTNVVFHQGYLYGLDEGVMVCLDPENGERKWKRGRYGHGQTLLVGDLLLVMTEKGAVVLLEATPEEHRELGRFQALHSKTWNPPALAGPYLYVRNAGEAACYKLPTKA